MALTKLIDSSSFFPEGEAVITVIDFDSSKGLLKQAADSRIQDYITNITPEANKIYVHILAMGAGEYYGANRNADYFPEHNLIDYYKTFETSPAHIFRNHVNKNPAIAIGKVLFAIYNSRMHRVELIADIDTQKAPDIVERIERGEFPATSMACKTPYDVCSICGNKAHTRQEYCVHLREQLGKIYPDGRKVMALNVAPLKFFDMSVVIRPADVTSSVLQKVAHEYEPVVGSVDNAVSEGLTDEGISKQAEIKKLSEFIKEVEGGVITDYSENLDPMLSKVRDPDLATIDTLKNFKLHDVYTTMAHLGISPSISFLAELIARKVVGDHMEGVGGMVESFISHVGASNVELPKDEHCNHSVVSTIASVLTPSIHDTSLLPEYAEKRAFIMKQTNVGYIGNGPYIEETPYERFRAANLVHDGVEKNNLMNMLQTIVTIGGAALAAKWFITRTIEQKMHEVSVPSNNTGVKIILVKSASDYKLTYKLAKAAMVKSIKSK